MELFYIIVVIGTHFSFKELEYEIKELNKRWDGIDRMEADINKNERKSHNLM